MRKKYIFGKKLYISILTTIVVLLTTVATTFAWVGVFANSTFDQFSFNIKPSQISEDYNIVVSPTGEEGTFSDSIPEIEIKKQILINWGYPESAFIKETISGNFVDDEDKINMYFSNLRLDQATTLPNVNGNKITSLGDFKDVYGVLTNKYFKFDVYVSIEPIKIDVSSSNFLLDVFLNLDALSSEYKGRELYNPVYFPDDFLHPYDSLISNGTMILPSGARTVKASEKITYASVKSVYASRLAFEKYEVVEKGNSASYSGKSPKSALIYSGDDFDYPVCLNENRHEYNFGGILPNEYNLSTLNYNSSEWKYANWGYWVMDLPDSIYQTRGVESPTKDRIINKQTNCIVDSNNVDEQIGINQMMKITCYFWFEGWDADCWNAINNSPVNINLSFRMRNDEE